MSKKLLSGPYLLWMIGFTVIPLALIVFYGLTEAAHLLWPTSFPSEPPSTGRPCFYPWVFP